MYPTVVIVLVETQRSMVDVCEIHTSNASTLAGPVASESRPTTLGHLSFAVRPGHSTTDSEAESQLSNALHNQGTWVATRGYSQSKRESGGPVGTSG